jgi:RHS repeat-associated protein
LQHRLNSATINRTEQGQSVAISAIYVYDDSGYRAQGTVIINNGTPTVTNYLTDTMNPTGYTQVLEEHLGNSSSPNMSYIIGLDVVAQTNPSGTTSYLMPDALGSTRLVIDPTGTITARYQYDAYGNVLGTALGVLNPPATEILYTGQFFVVATLQYYLRARMYAPMTARFTTMDSFSGRFGDPRSLHKYVYAGNNPITRTDPTGHDWATALGTLITASIIGALFCVVANGLRNVSNGKDFFENAGWAALTGAVLAPICVLFPFLGVVLAGIGLGDSIDNALRVFGNPNATFNQKAAAVLLIGMNVWGGYAAADYASSTDSIWFNARLFAAEGVNGAPAFQREVLQIQERVAQLSEALGKSKDFGETMAYGLARDGSGKIVKIVGNNGSQNGYIRPGVRKILAPDEIIASGREDAEMNVLMYMKQNNLEPITIGATRPVCDNCAMSLSFEGVMIATPLKTPPN